MDFIYLCPEINTKNMFKNFYTVLYLTMSFVFLSGALGAQEQMKLSGVVTGEIVNVPISGATVKQVVGEATTFTDWEGKFELILPKSATYDVLITYPGYDDYSLKFSDDGSAHFDAGSIALTRNVKRDDGADAIPTVSLDEGDGTEGNQDVSSILSASRDLYLSTAAFTFSAARFRIRGLDRRHGQLYMNGVQVFDPESGFSGFGTWGGLNDVVRKNVSQIGLNANDVTFGDIETNAVIDARAGSQRPGTSVSFAISNRTYRQRVMATHSSGWTENNWAFSISGSRRWAQEGYIDGTHYMGNSLYIGIDKKIGNHRFSLTGFAAPLERGMSNGAIQEMYDISGTNYYNSNWGYQEGEKRNSRVRKTNEPMVILNHEFVKTNKLTWMNALSFQSGTYSTTALDWYNARDPRPDYYRYLPSAITGSDETAEQVYQTLRDNEALRQIDWSRLYNANRGIFTTINNVNGIEGNSVTGLRSTYIVENRAVKRTQANFNSYFTYLTDSSLKISGGIKGQYYKSDNYKEIEDLLGGDFYLDINQFVERDLPELGETGIQSDLNNPNRVVREGDRFGYNYENHVRFGEIWVQPQWNFSKMDVFVSGKVSATRFWRDGIYRSGAFPNDSEGKSIVSDFLNYGLKGGLTYKFDGRNYVYFNTAYITNAPNVRNSFLSPRTRNQLASNLTDEKVLNNEIAFVHRSSKGSLKVAGYYTTINDQLNTRSFYLDQIEGTNGAFVNYAMSNVDQRFMGIEFSGELPLFGGLSLVGVANIGEYIYTDRPEAVVTIDNVGILLDPKTIYIKNYYVEGTPQTVGSLGLKYNSPKFWFVNLNVNYFDRNYLSMNYDRRTIEGVGGLTTENEALIQSIIGQEKAPSAITVDVFGGKSWRLKNGNYINLNIGINNVLNYQNFITGGFEQFRFDYNGVQTNVDRFPTKYFYGYGANYFINLTYRL